MNKKQQLVERHIKEVKKNSRKQKLHDARRKTGRKNTTKKPRLKKISLNDWEALDGFEFDNFSKIMPLGSGEYHREMEKIVINERTKEHSTSTQYQVLLENDLENDQNECIRCLVIEASSSMCRVDYKGESIVCELRGNVKDAMTGYINPVAVGDWVLVTSDGFNRGVVEAVLPRRSVLARPYSPDQGKILEDLYQIVAANVDRILIVASWREPYLWPALIDRYLITAQRNRIEPIICINKIDLVDDMQELSEVVQVYEKLNYKLILTSATNQEGIEPLRRIFQDGTTALAGLSGVGKSTLLTAVQPSLDLKIGEVSERGLFTGQGRHTTTQSSLWQLENGGVVIDTPGIRSFAIAGIQPTELGNWYHEMVPHIPDCHFNDCTHIDEPECAVKHAVEQGKVSRLRYKNYIQLYQELSST